MWIDPNTPEIVWHQTLINGLQSHLKGSPGSIIVRKRYYPNDRPIIGGKEKGGQLFAEFPNEESLFNHLQAVPEQQRDYYEFVRDHQAQKPRFDIDIHGEPGQDLDRLYKEVSESLDQAITKCIGDGVVIKSYTSHGTSKRSGHKVVVNHHHAHSRSAKALYFNAMSYVDSKFHQYIDRAVYSKGQNFRLLYCQKWYSDRPKKLVGTDGKFNLQDFRDSLLTYITKDSKVIVCDELVIRKPSINILAIIGDPLALSVPEVLRERIPQDIVEAGLQMLAAQQGKSVYELSYVVRSVVGNYILLNRTMSSYCYLHRREHDSENPYMYARKCGVDGAYDISFCCRRDPPMSTMLGRKHPSGIELINLAPSTEGDSKSTTIIPANDNHSDCAKEVKCTTVTNLLLTSPCGPVGRGVQVGGCPVNPVKQNDSQCQIPCLRDFYQRSFGKSKLTDEQIRKPIIWNPPIEA